MKRRWIRLLVFPIMVFGALQGLAASPVYCAGQYRYVHRSGHPLFGFMGSRGVWTGHRRDWRHSALNPCLRPADQPGPQRNGSGLRQESRDARSDRPTPPFPIRLHARPASGRGGDYRGRHGGICLGRWRGPCWLVWLPAGWPRRKRRIRCFASALSYGKLAAGRQNDATSRLTRWSFQTLAVQLRAQSARSG